MTLQIILYIRTTCFLLCSIGKKKKKEPEKSTGKKVVISKQCLIMTDIQQFEDIQDRGDHEGILLMWLIQIYVVSEMA